MKIFFTRDVLWNYFSVFVKIINTLIITVICNRYFSSKELTYWYLILSYNTIYLAFSIGIQPTLSRHLQFLILENPKNKRQNSYISGILGLYGILGILAFIINTTFFLITGFIENMNIIILFSFLIFINVSSTSLETILTAQNKIGIIKKYLTIGLLIQLLLFLATYRIGLSSFLIAAFIGVLIHKIFLYNTLKLKHVEFKVKDIFSAIADIGSSIRYSLKQLIGSLSGYAIIRLPILIGPLFLSEDNIQELGLSIQFLSLTILVSSVLVESKIPLLIEKFRLNDHNYLRKFSNTILTINISNFLVCCIIFLFFSEIFILIFKRGIMNSSALKIILIMIYIFENNHSLFQNIYATTDKLYYYKYNLVTLGIILSIISILHATNLLSLQNILLTILISNIVNNIIWPWKVFRLIKKY